MHAVTIKLSALDDALEVSKKNLLCYNTALSYTALSTSCSNCYFCKADDQLRVDFFFKSAMDLIAANHVRA